MLAIIDGWTKVVHIISIMSKHCGFPLDQSRADPAAVKSGFKEREQVIWAENADHHTPNALISPEINLESSGLGEEITILIVMRKSFWPEPGGDRRIQSEGTPCPSQSETKGQLEWSSE